MAEITRHTHIHWWRSGMIPSPLVSHEGSFLSPPPMAPSSHLYSVFIGRIPIWHIISFTVGCFLYTVSSPDRNGNSQEPGLWAGAVAPCSHPPHNKCSINFFWISEFQLTPGFLLIGHHQFFPVILSLAFPSPARLTSSRSISLVEKGNSKTKLKKGERKTSRKLSIKLLNLLLSLYNYTVDAWTPHRSYSLHFNLGHTPLASTQ